MSQRSNKGRKDKRKKSQGAASVGSPGEIEAALTASYEKLQSGQFEKAEQVLRKALSRNGKDARLMANLVATLENLGRIDDAQRVAEVSATANPDDAQTWNNLGAVLKFQGRLDDASEKFRRAVELSPAYANAWRNLAGLKKFTDPKDPDLAAMCALLPKLGRNEDSRTALYFAIAKAYDEIGDVDEAFTHFERGNRHRRARVTFSIAEMTQLVDETIEYFTAEVIGKGPAAGAVDDAPVLIVGMPRSGSTLVEQILASHPEVEGVGEVPELPMAIQPHVRDPRFRVQEIAALGDKELAAIGRVYTQALARRAPGAGRIADKFLTNFVYLGTLRRAVPNARFIHVRRNPMDNGFGCYRTLFTSNLPYVYDFEEIAGTYAQTHRLFDHWRDVAPESFIDVDYESLVADMEGETRRMLDFLALPWDDACSRFHETERRVNSASATQVRQPLYGSSIARWRPYSKHLRPLAEAFERHGVSTDFDEAAAE